MKPTPKTKPIKGKPSRKTVLETPGCPKREIKIGCDDANLIVGNEGIAIAGDRSHAFGGLEAVVVVDDVGCAECSGVMASVRDGSTAVVGDCSMARARVRSLAYGYHRSVAYSFTDGRAVTHKQGVSLAYAGLAESLEHGFAIVFNSDPDIDGNTIKGIAIAGECGVAVAHGDGALVQAGPGGLLLGYWTQMKGQKMITRVAARRVGGKFKANRLYRFTAGKFHELNRAEMKTANDNLKRLRAVGCTEKCTGPGPLGAR